MCLPYLIEQLEENLNRLAQSNRDLREAQQQLIQSEKMASVGQLAAGVAHEVNNPLGTILLYSHMMLEKLGEKDPRREELDTIAKEAARCRDIVRGLLDFARQRRLQIENIEINRILRETAALAGKQPSFQMIEIREDLDPSLPLLSGDPVQLREVFQNIIFNAGDAMPEGGSLTIRSRFNPGSQAVEVAVHDTGHGIPPENLNKIFMPFFTTKKVGKGTGLGLGHRLRNRQDAPGGDRGGQPGRRGHNLYGSAPRRPVFLAPRGTHRGPFRGKGRPVGSARRLKKWTCPPKS